MFPHLRSFSRSLGLQLHVVDLYRDLPSVWLPAGPSREEGRGEGGEEERGGKGEAEGEQEEEEGGGGGRGSEVMCGLELRGLFQLALKEIHICQDMSAGPGFIVSITDPHIPLILCVYMYALFRLYWDRSMGTSLSLPPSQRKNTLSCVVPCRTLLTNGNWCNSGTS